MRFSRVTATAIALCLVSPALLAQKQLALLTLVSSVSGLDVAVSKANIKVTEDGNRLTVSHLELVPRVPKLQLLIDNGAGLTGGLADLRTGLKGLLAQLPPGLEVTLVTTAPQPRMLEPATTDRAKLVAAIDRLTPDAGSGRFVEGLFEAMNRVDQDRDDNADYVIVNVATSTGELNFREDDVKKTAEQVRKHHPTIYTILLNANNSASAGGVQTDFGEGLANMTGGHFESIAISNRLPTLLPELGAALERLMGATARQLRVTVERAGSGPIGQIGMTIDGLSVLHTTLDLARTK
ncbi:MAG TPA: VWA domain-containing protein [Vicinamibacterales bacterium]|jgi:hypothetical protein|nr:VWA domain-containing protein [Vicinamibacterales bacterium]